MAALSQETDFNRELLAGDVVEVRSQVIEIVQGVYKANDLLADGLAN